jgi:O-antigen ligase
MIADLVALGIVPLVVLVVLYILIFREISRATRLHNAISTQKRNNSQAVKMLVAVVGVFALSHSLR